jgi:tungstate transport system substrate-binding protein
MGVKVATVLTNPAPRLVRSSRAHRTLIVLVACLAVLVGFIVSPPTSRAEPNSSTLTIIGTSDVKDSGLFDNVLGPDFTSFYDGTHPGADISVGYVSKSSQAAITGAEAGTASALLVHAASLENQFVGSGFSAEPFGRAVFDGDFVLLGPKSDPAQIGTKDPTDIVGAFQDIAAAGATSNGANFVSRNDNSGTNVQEHAIWNLTNVTSCTVDTTNGGGNMPSTTGGACPQPAPSWYQETSQTQAANVELTDVCSFPGGPNNCYTLTDRGTFDNLVNTHAIANLKIVTQNNSRSAPGGNTLLVNSFHAYAVNPAAVPSNSQVNLPLATAFLNWLTSPAGQTDVNNYLKTAPGGAPFRKDAAPVLTASTLPKVVNAGKKLTIKGSLSNIVTGTPLLVGKTVTLSALRTSVSRANPKALPVKVATTKTNATGDYAFHYRPNANARYTVSTDQITQLENANLSPNFEDLLAPASKSLGRSRVRGSVSIRRLTAQKGRITVRGSVAPAPTNAFSHLSLYAAKGHHALKFVARRHVKAGKTRFVAHFHLQRGFTWRLRLKYVNNGQTNSGLSARRSVTLR